MVVILTPIVLMVVGTPGEGCVTKQMFLPWKWWDVELLVGRATQFRLSFEPHQQTNMSHHFSISLKLVMDPHFLWHDTTIVWLVVIFCGLDFRLWVRPHLLQVVQIKGDAIRHAWHTLWEEPIWGSKKKSACWAYLLCTGANKIKVGIRFFSRELDDPHSTPSGQICSFWCAVRFCGNCMQLPKLGFFRKYPSSTGDQKSNCANPCNV